MTYRPVLVDIGGLHACCTDHALEALHKALSDEDGLAHDIWAEHENPFIRRLVEQFSERGLLRLAAVREELSGWLAGTKYKPGAPAPAVPPGYMGRWSEDELSLVRLYLESLPPGSFTLSDWGRVIDYLVQRYLPADELRTDAEWLAVRSTMMGKVQANMGAAPVGAIDTVLAALPLTVSAAAGMFSLPGALPAIMDYAKERCAEQVVALSDSARHQLRTAIIDHQSRVLLGDPTASHETLEQVLLDRFGTLNRDWRRIAVTEAGENANQGVIASLAPGSRVKRLEQYAGACPWCRKIDGRVMVVKDAGDQKKDGESDVWPGKTNVGRSASPRKRAEDGTLVDRLPSERWWVAAGTQHPHCRGRWIPLADPKPGDDPEFSAWLDKHLGIA